MDWRPMIDSLLADMTSVDRTILAAKFHNTLANYILSIAQHSGMRKIVLSGGTFQNKYLVEKIITKLSAEGFRVYTHQQVPPNDGGIALGQIAAFHYSQH